MQGQQLTVYPVAKNSRPYWITEYIGRIIVLFAGVLPLARAVRGAVSNVCRRSLLTVQGNVSDDPAVEEDFYKDGMCRALVNDGLLIQLGLCYHGWLRVGTGLALLEGMTELEKRAEEINIREHLSRQTRS